MDSFQHSLMVERICTASSLSEEELVVFTQRCGFELASTSYELTYYRVRLAQLAAGSKGINRVSQYVNYVTLKIDITSNLWRI